jgi:hypothetical protein
VSTTDARPLPAPAGWASRVPGWAWALASAVVVATAALVLLAMGRVPICRCGTVKLWHGVVASAENSQHLSDWYTFSHIIHGFLFYAALWLVARRLPVGLRLLVAVTLECGWEIFENTDYVINRYRAVTISLDYYGDSVINSVSDVLAMVTGFALAWRLRTWIVVALALALELYVGWRIHDNLTLNIIMLVHPTEAIRRWQMGA